MFAVASISLDCPQLFPKTFHKDFPKSAIPDFFSAIDSQSGMLVTRFAIFQCQSESAFLNVLIFFDNNDFGSRAIKKHVKKNTYIFYGLAVRVDKPPSCTTVRDSGYLFYFI